MGKAKDLYQKFTGSIQTNYEAEALVRNEVYRMLMELRDLAEDKQKAEEIIDKVYEKFRSHIRIYNHMAWLFKEYSEQIRDHLISILSEAYETW